MAILWCGSEDIDFPNGGAVTTDSTAGYFRASYARGTIYNANAGVMLRSIPFPGGAVTSCWFSFYGRTFTSLSTSKGYVGLGLSNTAKGLFIGSGASSTKLALLKFDGTTWTVLASESGTSLTVATLHRFDIQVIDFGANATINVYLGGALLVTYTGDVTVSGMSNFDSVFTYCPLNATLIGLSEVIVADDDTRTLSLVTLAPAAAGDANAWTGAYTAVDEIATNDADVVYTNTADQNCQFNLSNLPAGTFIIKGVKNAARVAKSASATANKLKLGVKTNSTVNVDTGSAATTAWVTQERYMATNPVTAADWSMAEIDALQINLQSATV